MCDTVSVTVSTDTGTDRPTSLAIHRLSMYVLNHRASAEYQAKLMAPRNMNKFVFIRDNIIK